MRRWFVTAGALLALMLGASVMLSVSVRAQTPPRQVLREDLSGLDGQEVIMQEVVLPPGGSIADKFIFALMKEPATMVGMIVTDRNWPNNSSWWIALMLVAPAERGKGVAFSFAAAVLDWIEGQGPQ